MVQSILLPCRSSPHATEGPFLCTSKAIAGTEGILLVLIAACNTFMDVSTQ